MTNEKTILEKTDIRLCSLEELSQYLTGLGEPKFRAKQIYEWLWQKGVHQFEAMTNLPKPLREKLETNFAIRPIQTDTVQKSIDGTIKNRFRLYDGYMIETVLIPVPSENRYTVCVSSQVGCSLTCKFCATGQMGRKRNLDPAEIYDQVLLVNRQTLEIYGHHLTNIVFMGMGEPLLTYKNVMEGIDKITSPQGLNISAKRITLSTAGIAKMIKKLADDKVRFHLALSLHAADDTKRNEIMPINEHNNLEALAEALQYFQENTKDNKITFEYTGLQDFNDSIEDAKQLVAFCKKIQNIHVNIIEYNPIEGGIFEKTKEHKLNAFAHYLHEQGVEVTVRRSRGRDIDAACGQLANKGGA